MSAAQQLHLSIIIPVYNLSGFITETLKSVIAQKTTFNYEVIVVNDGSTDDTESVVEQLIESELTNNIRCIQNKFNKGVSGARNTGLDEAKGQWITFLDGDDIWPSDAIEKKLSITKDNDIVDFISSGFKRWYYLDNKLVSEKQRCSGLRDFLNANDNMGQIYIETPLSVLLDTPELVYTGTLFVKNELLKQVGSFDTKLEMGEDRDLQLRIALKSKLFCYVNDDLFLYRSRPGSLTGVGVPGSIWAEKSIKNLLLRDDFKNFKQPLKKTLSEHLAGNAYYYRQKKQFGKAIVKSLDSIQNNPQNLSAWKCLVASVIRR